MCTPKCPGACRRSPHQAGPAPRRARRVAALLPAALLALLLAETPAPSHAAAERQAPATGAPATARQAPAPAPSAPPRRTVTLAPHITELVFAAGAGDRIVGTVSSSNYPPEANAIARVGDGLLLNTETLLALHPDLVLAWAPSAAVRKLIATGLQVQYSQPRTLDDIPGEVLRLGRLFGTEDTAAPLAQNLRQRLAALRTRHAGQAPVRVFLDLGDTPLYTLGDEPLFNSLLAACGGVNLYADAGVPAPQVSPESVLARQPDVVLLATAQQAGARQTPWKQLKLGAAQQGRLHEIDPDALLRPGPRLITAAEQICAHLEAFRRAGAGSTPTQPAQ